ncbi:MAG: hypothetical protein ACPL1K_02740 [Candidatus Kryptoniota bacterium]
MKSKHPYLTEYVPRSGDVVLFRPKYFFEHIICWLLKSDYSHVGIVDVNRGDEAHILEQNIDFVPVENRKISNYIKDRELLVLRCPYLTRWTRNKIISIFQRLQAAHYSYRDAFRIALRKLFKISDDDVEYTYLFLNPTTGRWLITARVYLSNRCKDFAYEIRDRYTCSAAIAIAFYVTLAKYINPNEIFNDKPLWYVDPTDFLNSSHFDVLGLIDKNTRIVSWASANDDDNRT